MAQSACALFVLFIAVLNSVFIPFFRRTRKGILIIHWTIVNYITASRSYPDLGYSSVTNDVTLLTASFLVLLEHYITRHRTGREVSSNERNLLLVLLVAFDVISCSLSEDLRAFARVAVVGSTVLVAARLYLTEPRNPHRMNHMQLEQIKHDDLFYSWNDPFSCFGLLGTLCLSTVLLNSVIHISHSLQKVQLLVYGVYVMRAVTTLGFSFAPAFFAGMVQSMKTIGRLIEEFKAMNNAPKIKMLDETIDEGCLVVPSSNPTVIQLA